MVELIELLNRRVMRLNNLVKINAPSIMQKTELMLIKDACNKLLNLVAL